MEEGSSGFTIMELKHMAVDALLGYRRMRARLQELETTPEVPAQGLPEDARRFSRSRPVSARPSAEELELMRGWVAAIDGARALLRRTYPLKERFMARCFGLDIPIPRSQGVKARLIKLSMDLHISQSTLYKWREDAIALTLYGAIEAGVVRPYGLRRVAG